jgi:hypothetical protein
MCKEFEAAVFNMSAGTAPGTVVFTLVRNGPEAAIGLCVDFNAGISQLELYPCYGYENKQQVRSKEPVPASCRPCSHAHFAVALSAHPQEWIANYSSGALQQDNNGQCLCPDTRNSQSSTASRSFSATPSPSHPPLPQQRITTCDCDGSAEQGWLYYPDVGSLGPVRNLATFQCWAIVTDNCAVANDDDPAQFSACVELQVRIA